MTSARSRRGAARALLLSSLRGRRRALGELAAWSLVAALPAFLSGRLVARALDDGFLHADTSKGFAWLGAFAASALIGAFGTRQAYIRLAALVEPFRDELAALTVRGALRRSTTPGAAHEEAGVARLTQQVEIAREALASVLMVVQGFVVTAGSALVGLLTLFPAALALVLPPLLLGLVLFLVLLGRMAARQRSSIVADEEIARAAGVLGSGLRDVVACGGEEKVAAVVGERIDAQAQATRQVAGLTAVGTLAIAAGGWLPILLILAGGSWLVDQGASTGAILGALTYVSQGVHPAMESLVRGLGGPGLWLMVALSRIAEATDVPEPAQAARAGYGRDGGRPRDAALRIRGVTFAYSPWADPVIRELDLHVPAGDHLAVVGPSGVGKSTLANLIAGMLEPQAGEVRIGGVPVRDLDPRRLAQERVLIPQEAYVFAGTLWENLTYLGQGAELADVDMAVDRLGMRALVERLGGYGAELRPSELSAGERQLVTLVRAYLSPARLAVLDEATCHLDPAAEARVERALALRPGSLIVVAHRISSALRARRILVLDGTRVELGTHEELLTRSPLYRDLVGRWQSGAVMPSLEAPTTLDVPGDKGPHRLGALYDWLAATGTKIAAMRRERWQPFGHE